jgi:hypothetical protein
MMVSFLLGKQNFSFIIEGRTGEKQWGCPLSAESYSRKQGDLQTVRYQASRLTVILNVKKASLTWREAVYIDTADLSLRKRKDTENGIISNLSFPFSVV